MNLTYQVTAHSDYLLIKFRGAYCLNDSMKALRSILHECDKFEIYHVIIDFLEMENTNVPSMQRYQLGNEAAKIFTHRIKAAILYPAEDTNRLFENVAVNRFANIRVFPEMHKALAWLNVTIDPPGGPSKNISKRKLSKDEPR